MAALKPGPAKEKPYLRQVSYAGLPVTVDRPKGHVVEGIDSHTGQPYRTEYAVDYGYLRRTRGGDGEGLDVFLGPDESELKVFWVTHLRNDGSFDEFKLFLGYRNAVDAQAEYLRHYPARWFGGIREGSMGQVRALLCLDPQVTIKSPRQAVLDVFESRMALREWADANTVLLDIGVADVHIAGGGGVYRPGPPTRPKELMMSDLTAAQRDALRASDFAIPSERKYPIQDAEHVRAAEDYIEKEHNAGKVSEAQYTSARGKIARAAKKFGIESKYNKTGPGRRKIRVHADIAEGGALHVHHMSEERATYLLPIVTLSVGDEEPAAAT